MRYFLQQEDFKFVQVDVATYNKVPEGYVGNRFKVNPYGLFHVELANVFIGDFLDALKLASSNSSEWL